VSNQHTTIQIVIAPPDVVNFGNGDIVKGKPYDTDELKYLLNGKTSIATLRSNGLCCLGKRGYLGQGVLAALSAGSFKVKENENEEEETAGEACYQDGRSPFHIIPTGETEMESGRDRRKRLQGKGSL